MVSIIMLVPNHTSTFLGPNTIRGARGVVDNFDMLNAVGCYGCPDPLDLSEFEATQNQPEAKSGKSA